MTSITDSIEEILGEPKVATDLPIDRLSPSSIQDYWNCPERWRRDRIHKEPRPATGSQIFGSSFHRAVEFNLVQKIDSHQDIPTPEMRDLAGDAFNEVVAEEKGEREIIWNDEVPHKVQEGVIGAVVGAGGAPGYHQVLAPKVQPVSVERWVEVDTPFGLPLVGKLDVEADAGRQIIDLKTGKSSKPQVEIDKNIQATAYLWARKREDNPAERFSWQVSVRTIKPKQQELETTRTTAELDQFERLMLMTLASIRHNLGQYGTDSPWPGASPLGWWCTPKECSFWPTCIWRGGAK